MIFTDWLFEFTMLGSVQLSYFHTYRVSQWQNNRWLHATWVTATTGDNHWSPFFPKTNHWSLSFLMTNHWSLPFLMTNHWSPYTNTNFYLEFLCTLSTPVSIHTVLKNCLEYNIYEIWGKMKNHVIIFFVFVFLQKHSFSQNVALYSSSYNFQQQQKNPASFS